MAQTQKPSQNRTNPAGHCTSLGTNGRPQRAGIGCTRDPPCLHQSKGTRNYRNVRQVPSVCNIPNYMGCKRSCTQQASKASHGQQGHYAHHPDQRGLSYNAQDSKASSNRQASRPLLNHPDQQGLTAQISKVCSKPFDQQSLL